ncbi:FG-GAP repeat domain-containing protein [Streptomyces jumonjinensis]|uniref:Integrin-like protein n=1 Tax=Streptomyces jumonjinensis TaxID=1945 RepID=A0A646KG94_STRJU|nr:FG-GAP and VCBS repeat-containing protein [Streptomyces jumonjinensis]MQT01299.1 integrin-like protein [Streptomyces jumonjinensis]
MRTSIRTALATAVTVSLAGGLLGLTTGSVSAAPAKPAKAAKHPDDYNGDGYRDYAIKTDDNSVTVTYGTKSGPGTKTFRFNQDSPGIPGEHDGDDDEVFGDDLASADFNGDGYADLAVSDEEELVHQQDPDRGLVVIVWGSKSGLGSQATELPAAAEKRVRFGGNLAAGDFDGDGKPDLALTDDRFLHIYRGGFTPAGGTGGITTHTSGGMSSFYTLVAGEVTKDKATDLYAIGDSWADGKRNSSTWFLKGGAAIEPGTPVPYRTNTYVGYGSSGVVADFDKDGYGDLAFSDYAYRNYSGSVLVLRGGENGPADSRRITQDTAGIATVADPRDRFGTQLSAGDTDRDGYPDLAVGTEEAVGEALGEERAGGAHVLHGGKKGLTGAGSKWFTRETKGFPGKARAYAKFGSEVRLRDTDRDGYADLLMSGDSKRGTYDGILLGGGKGGVTVKQLRKVNLTATFPQ